MRKCLLRRAVSIVAATVLAAGSASANESLAEGRIRQVENGLLPRVSLKENFGRAESITDRMRAWGIPGASIAVIDDGRVAWTRAYGVSDSTEQTPVTEQTLFQAASISKPIAALGALRLIKERKLSLDDGVNAALKNWRVPDNEFTRDENVTVRRLLNHTAGVTVHGFPGYAVGTPVPSVVQVLDGVPPANTAPVRVDVRPGSAYRYSGGGYTVLQLLIAEAANEPFESFMQSKVLDVIGMTSSTYSQTLAPALVARRASGHRIGGERIPGKLHIYPEMAAAGLWTTPSDLAQYLLYVQAALRAEENALLTASLAKELVSGPKGEHGLGPEIYEVGEFARFGHNGVNQGFEAAMVAYVDRGKGVVIMANANAASMFFDEVKASVARAYGWPGFPIRPQRQIERIPSSLLKRAPGAYRISPTTTAMLTAKRGRLFFKTSDGATFELFAQSGAQLLCFALTSGTLRLREIDGKVTALQASDGREFARID